MQVIPVLTKVLLLGFGLLATCIVTFIIMFLPRSRQLTAMGKEGVYLEDHEDQLSLGGREGGGEEFSYSPAAHFSSQHSSKKLDKQRYERRQGNSSDDVYQNGSYLGR